MARPEKALIDLVHIRKNLRADEDLENMRLNRTAFRKIIDRKRRDDFMRAASAVVDPKKMELLRRYAGA